MILLHQLIDWIVTTVSQLGYTGIMIMMFLESSFFPFPSEVVMVPAGYLAFQGKMNLVTATLMGILGSLLGGIFNYYIAVWFGRPFLQKWGKYFFISPEKLDKVETFFMNHGEISTFTGRLIPVIRQYISFPAGLARMNIPRFLFFTGLGAGLWCMILVFIGYIAGKNEALIKQHINTALLSLLVLSSVLLSLYIYLHRKKKKKIAAAQRKGK